jgi:hypothetical protein
MSLRDGDSLSDSPEAHDFLSERGLSKEDLEWEEHERSRTERLDEEAREHREAGFQFQENGCPTKKGPVTVVGPDMRARDVMFECGRWICEACASVRIDEVKSNLLLHHGATGFRPNVHVITAYRYAVSVREKLKREDPKPDTLRMSLKDDKGKPGLLLVSSGPVSGRGWATEEMSLFEAMRLLTKRPDGVTYKEKNWTGKWVPEAIPTGGSWEFKHKYRTPQEKEEHFDRAGAVKGYPLTPEVISALKEQLSAERSDGEPVTQYIGKGWRSL